MQATGDFTSAVILPVDVEDIGDAYNFIADVPGLEKGDIKVCAPLSVSDVRECAAAWCYLWHSSPQTDGSVAAATPLFCTLKGYTYLCLRILSGSASPTAIA